MEKDSYSFILMGVSSTGKSTIGAEVARRLGIKFIDGDDLHPKCNILKMKQGIPLDDESRLPWLERISDAAFSLAQKTETGIIVCSALKRKYRDLIRSGNENVRFIFLSGDFELILARMKLRQGHFMKTEMLRSQFATLEMPQQDETDVISVNIDCTFEELVERVIQTIHTSFPH
ncbi:gluconate kinase [Pasteurellaceae bacterium Macca]|nr:gluconate kinase [Pasteurellaceae bacterium Macca]